MPAPPQPTLGLIPHLTVSNAAAAIAFYTAAFDATELTRHHAPHSERIMHARLHLHGCPLLLNDDFPEYMNGKSSTPQAFGGCPAVLHLQVADADVVWAQALAAGAQVVMPLKDQFWGDRYGKLLDPFGYTWSIAHTLHTPDPEQMRRDAEASFTQAQA